MDYEKIYNQLISKYKNTIPSGYYETHHIIPKCIGGSDEKQNLICLTAKQHFLAHLLLAKIHGGKLAQAAWIMSGYGKTNSKKYEWLRIRFSETMKNNQYGKELKGIKRSENFKNKLSLRSKGNQYGKKKRSEQTKANMSKARKGIQSPLKGRKMPPMSLENRIKISKGKVGKNLSESHKQKIREGHIKRLERIKNENTKSQSQSV